MMSPTWGEAQPLVVQTTKCSNTWKQERETMELSARHAGHAVAHHQQTHRAQMYKLI